MDVIPAIDLRGGRCVRLFQGDYDKETVFSEDPAATARRWRDLGATRLHTVDLDGAKDGVLTNAAAIRAIVRGVNLPVGMGGGLRTIETIAEVHGWGIDRLHLGTAAVRDPELVREACARFPNAVVVSVDARNGKVALDGWRTATDTDALDLIAEMAALGVPRFVYTDIARDGTNTEPNFAALAQVVAAAGRPVVAAGGVSKVEHLLRLRDLGVEGAIIGQALYTGAIDLPQALHALAA